MRAGQVVRVLRVSLLTAVALGNAVAIGQGENHAGGTQQSGTSSPIVLPPLDSPDWGAKVRMTPEQGRAMREERHQRAQADIQKMTGLLSDLNTEFEKASKDEVSVTVLKEAKEIEKLARDVQTQEKSVARETRSGERERGSEIEFGFVHVSVEAR